MARHKDLNWNLPTESTWDAAKLAVLMDIRDELKRLNLIIHCPNFIDIPNVLRRIEMNTLPKKRTRRRASR